MKTELQLSNEGIDRASDMVASFLTNTGANERETMAGRLAFESALLFLKTHSGDDTVATITIGKRFGKPCLAVASPGERFDPFTMAENFAKDEVRMGRLIMVSAGVKPHYAYRGGKNIISLRRPRPPLSTLFQILVAFVLGLVVALMGNTFLSEGQRTYALDTLVMPFFNVYLGMLGGLAGPLVFLSVASGICDIGDVGALGRNGKSLVGRFFRDNTIATVAAVLVCILAFPLPAREAVGTGDLLGDLVELLVGLLPTNVVVPFVEGNTTQIILIGAFVGIAVLVLGSVCDGIRRQIGEFNVLVQFLMEQLCRFIPSFIFLMVVSQVWSGTFSSMLDAWYPLLMFALISIAFFLVRVVYTSLRFNVPLGKIFVALRPAMTLALTTASSCAALGSMLKGCEELGVSDEQSSFGIPLGIVVCQPPTIVMLSVLMMYCMQSCGLGADVAWYVRLALVCFLYSIVAPPVPGGMLVCFGLMFGELGIPSSALALVTTLTVIMDYVLTSLRVGAIINTVLDAGCAIGTVDRSKFENS